MTPIESTQAWLEKAVIGLGLCPFAKAVHSKGQIRWVESLAGTPQELLIELGAELQALAAADPIRIDTTMLVHPHVLRDFEDYNDFLDLADALLDELELDGVLQIASFHPDYRFAGSTGDAMGNFSNQSPYPTLHLLRETSVAQAVAAFPDAASIYERNIETLERLGLAGWRDLGLDAD